MRQRLSGNAASVLVGFALVTVGGALAAQEASEGSSSVEEQIDALAAPPDAAACRAASLRLAETDGRDEEASAIALSEECTQLREANAFDVRGRMAEISALLREEGIDFDSRISQRMAACQGQVDARLAAVQEAEEQEQAPVRPQMAENRNGAAWVPSLERAPITSADPEEETPPDPVFLEKRAEMIAVCEANAEVALYAEGITTLNQSRAERAEIEQAEYKAQLERIAEEAAEAQAIYKRKVEADRAAHEAAMADWRRRVALCEKGKREYCAKDE